MGASRRGVRRKPPRHGIRRLERLVRALGIKETARRAGVSASTVSRWRKHGVSEAGREDLLAVERRRNAARAAAQARSAQARKEEAARERRREAARQRREKKRAERERDKKKRAREERQRLIREAKEREKKERLQRLKEERKRALREARDKQKQKRREEAQARRARERARKEALKRRREEERKRREAEKVKKVEKKDERKRRLRRMAEACRLFDNNNTMIAQTAGVDESTVRRWMYDPPLRSKGFFFQDTATTEIHTLLELLKLAGEKDKLPVVRPGEGERSGRKIEGVYWTRAIMQRLTPSVIREIGKWVRSLRGRYPYWQAVVVTSQFAMLPTTEFRDAGPKKTTTDYPTVFVQLKHGRWGDFAADRPEPSAEARSQGGAAKDIQERLTARLESGLVQVFVHGVTVFAYRRRTKKEQSAWATEQRQERMKQWQTTQQKNR
jgi:hypothetical protein